MKNVFLILILGLVTFSCKKVSPLDYIEWIENQDNGLRKEKTIGDYRFEIQYCPKNYLQIKRGNYDSTSSTEIIKNNSGLCFIFRIERLSDKDNHSLFQLINEANFSLISESDTIRSSMVLYENNFKISSIESYSVYFDVYQIKNDIRFVYQDEVLTTGPVIFSFKIQDIKRIPEINN